MQRRVSGVAIVGWWTDTVKNAEVEKNVTYLKVSSAKTAEQKAELNEEYERSKGESQYIS